MFTPSNNFITPVNSAKNGKLSYTYPNSTYTYASAICTYAKVIGFMIFILTVLGVFTNSIAELECAVTSQLVYVSLLFYRNYLYLPYECLLCLSVVTGFNYQFAKN
jgi:hypothetical protein